MSYHCTRCRLHISHETYRMVASEFGLSRVFLCVPVSITNGSSRMNNNSDNVKINANFPRIP